MDNVTREAIKNINEKLGWVERSHQRIISDLKNVDNVKDNFWAYISAFHQIWFYFAKWNNERNSTIIESAKVVIERWKSTSLNTDEKTSWDLLGQLRNDDTHRNPVAPNYKIVTVIIVDFDGIAIADNDNNVLGMNTEVLKIDYQGQEYDIPELCNNGLSGIRKLLEFISQ